MNVASWYLIKLFLLKTYPLKYHSLTSAACYLKRKKCIPLQSWKTLDNSAITLTDFWDIVGSLVRLLVSGVLGHKLPTLSVVVLENPNVKMSLGFEFNSMNICDKVYRIWSVIKTVI